MNSEKEYFDYLTQLRETGSINMFGAPACLETAFGVSRMKSFEIFERWAAGFEERESSDSID